MADRRQAPNRQNDQDTYDSVLHDAGVLWQGTSRRTGRSILTGTLSRGVVAEPIDILVTENTREDRSENAPSHRIFVRYPRRRTSAGNGTDEAPKGNDDLPF